MVKEIINEEKIFNCPTTLIRFDTYYHCPCKVKEIICATLAQIEGILQF